MDKFRPLRRARYTANSRRCFLYVTPTLAPPLTPQSSLPALLGRGVYPPYLGRTGPINRTADSASHQEDAAAPVNEDLPLPMGMLCT